MDVKTVKQLAELMGQYNLSELEFEQEGSRIHLCKNANVSATQPAPAVEAPAPVAAPKARESEPAHDYIKSPLVGTFYRSAGPENPPFVMEGATVEAGTVVCIVEAMKVMNEIKAEKRGVIGRILVENGAPVEYGQNMFELKPAEGRN